MSKNIIILVVLLIASAAFGAVYSDGIYAQNPDYHVARASEIVDINAKNGTAVAVKYLDKEAPPVADLGQVLADVSGNFSVDIDAQQTENKPVAGVNVSANYSVNKGPVYVQYSHTRCYSRYVDEYSSAASTDFSGTVNNKVTFGVSFAPDYSRTASNVASAPNGETVASAVAAPAAAATVRSSAIN